MARGEETKNRIDRTALALFVKKGVAATTTREIAAGASVSEPALYRHYGSKDDLAWTLFARMHLALGTGIAAAIASADDLQTQAAAIVHSYCELADEDWSSFAYHLVAQHLFLQRYSGEEGNPVSLVEGVIRDAMRAGQIPSRPVAFLASMTLGVVLQPAYHRLYGRFSAPLSEYEDMLSLGVWQLLKGEGRA